MGGSPQPSLWQRVKSAFLAYLSSGGCSLGSSHSLSCLGASRPHSSLASCVTGHAQGTGRSALVVVTASWEQTALLKAVKSWVGSSLGCSCWQMGAWQTLMTGVPACGTMLASRPYQL